MINVIIIDDENHARQLISNILVDCKQEIKVLASCKDLQEGVLAIKKLKPDLVFLDIEMPENSGLEILDFLEEDEINFEIIFVTAYNSYAIQAFKLSAIDYILKPITLNDIQDTLNRFDNLSKKNKNNLLALKENLTFNLEDKIALPTGTSIVFIKLSDVVYLKGEGSYTEIHFLDASKILASRTLKNFESIINFKSPFFRCHKSFIVNVNFIDSYEKSEGGFLILNKDIQINIAKEKVTELMEKINLIGRK